MAEKVLEVADVGTVSFFKRKGAKSVRVKVDDRGRVVVTMPPYMPYTLAKQFVREHRAWLAEQRSTRQQILPEGMLIGRVHLLRYVYDPYVSKPTVRVTASQIIVKHRENIADATVQDAATKGAVKALRREAQHYLPKRLSDIAAMEGYTFNEVSIKQLKGRWGSCDTHKNITFNLYLMQLPADCIDYVIYHELAHTRAMNHGDDFWREFEAHFPKARLYKRTMKQYQPTIPPKLDLQ